VARRAGTRSRMPVRSHPCAATSTPAMRGAEPVSLAPRLKQGASAAEKRRGAPSPVQAVAALTPNLERQTVCLQANRSGATSKQSRAPSMQQTRAQSAKVRLLVRGRGEFQGVPDRLIGALAGG